MKLATLTVFSGNRGPVLDEAWTFEQGRLQIISPYSGEKDIFTYTDKVRLHIRGASNYVMYDGYLYVNDTQRGKIGTLYHDEKPSLNQNKITLLMTADGNIKINKEKCPETLVKMPARINHSQVSNFAILIVTFEKENGLEFFVHKDGHQKTIQVGWDENAQLPTVTQILPSFWSRVHKKFKTITGRSFAPHYP